MGKGGISRAEFREGMQHKRRRSNDRNPETQKPKPAHIDLRVVRYASLDQGYENKRWNEYLNALARENRVLGSAIPLGTIAITEFSAQFMNEGLKEAWPNDYHHHKKKPRLFRKAKTQIDTFLQERQREHQWKRSEEMVNAQDIRMGHEFSSLTDESLAYDLDIDDEFDIEEEVDFFPFGQARLDTSQLEPYGRKYGIDLTLDRDDILREEFGQLHRFIGRSVFRNTVSQVGNLPFHATVFKLHDHVGMPEIGSKEAVMPPQMIFEKPQTEMHMVGIE